MPHPGSGTLELGVDPGHHLPQVRAHLLDLVPRSANCEVTVEANPDTVTPELVEVFAAGTPLRYTSSGTGVVAGATW